jgi:gamma-glutamyltranspeptidase / glutathione hydrolase
MVASSQKAASEVGIRILRRGGNAADAAVAMAAALNVTEPCSTGIGGDCFALYFSRGELTALNGSGRAPAALTRDRVTELSLFDANSVTVPGACAAWFDFIARHGSLPMREILAPAIRLAEEGFEVQPVTAHFWARGLPHVTSAELSIEGRAPRAGEVFRNPGLARTFRAIAEEGPDAFYRGPIAQSVVSVIRERGGVMALEDLAAHESTWDQPISTEFHGMRVWECPPNGQGIAALLALNILKQFDAGGVDRWHVMIEAMRLAFEDARWFVADPTVAATPIDELLSQAYALDRAKLIRMDTTLRDTRPGVPSSSSDTVYLCVIDEAGNACSFINSNYLGFGTGIVPPGWGFTLQNRGCTFTLEPGHVNELAPRKRPYHTIIPGMLTQVRDGSLIGPFGVMGGFMQPQGHLQVVSALSEGLSPQEALDRPRFRLDPEADDVKVYLEDGMSREIVDGLHAKGHDIVPGVAGYDRVMFGRGQIICRNPDGTLVGGSDSRADGCWLQLPDE